MHRVTTTKACPHCGDQYLVRFTSINRKWCSGCRAWLPWNLEPGQPPLLGPARKLPALLSEQAC